MARSTCLALVALTILAVIFTVASDSLDQDQLDLPVLQKRPFCNAFTGCGRKRSNQRESGDFQLSSRQSRLYALLQRKMAEVEAIRGLLDESQK